MKYLLILMFGLVMTSFTSDVAKKAKARIYVMDEASNLVEGAKVSLYKSQENYKSEKSAVASGKTTVKGYVEFRDLDEIVYYIHAIKGDLNNNGGNIQTDTLHRKGKNRFEVTID